MFATFSDNFHPKRIWFKIWFAGNLNRSRARSIGLVSPNSWACCQQSYSMGRTILGDNRFQDWRDQKKANLSHAVLTIYYMLYFVHIDFDLDGIHYSYPGYPGFPPHFSSQSFQCPENRRFVEFRHLPVVCGSPVWLSWDRSMFLASDLLETFKRKDF